MTVYGLEVRLSFRGFENDRDDRRAVFADARPEACFGAGVVEATRARWREAVGRWAGGGCGGGEGGGEEEGRVSLRPDVWSYWVEMRGLALDPELPGLRIDYGKREISFDWRRMLDEFFGEEAYARRCLEELETLDEKLEKDAVADAGERQESSGQIHMSGQGKTWHSELIGDGLLNPRRGLKELEHRAYVAARRQRTKKWYERQRRNEELQDDNWLSIRDDPLPDGVRDAAEHDRVLEMLRRREDLAKDVSICDNANEVRAVYRWNPEHDSINL